VGFEQYEKYIALGNQGDAILRRLISKKSSSHFFLNLICNSIRNLTCIQKDIRIEFLRKIFQEKKFIEIRVENRTFQFSEFKNISLGYEFQKFRQGGFLGLICSIISK